MSQQKAPYISICIPAYKSGMYLERLLDSIASQTYRDFEVVITDDCRDDTVFRTTEKFKDAFRIAYSHNAGILGMAGNWNEGIKKAKGTWIKIMHDDDFFTTNGSLQAFADATAGTDIKFVVGGFNACYEETATIKGFLISQAVFNRINNNPYLLFSSNKIGPPSVIMIHKKLANVAYDHHVRWLIDIAYYMSVMYGNKGAYIASPVINMSYNADQVTNDCFRHKDVEIPESLYMYQKHGPDLTRGLYLYDGWWRLVRNLDIKDVKELDDNSKGYPVPLFLKKIVNFQKLIPQGILLNGLASKLLMTFSYLFNNSAH